MRAPTGLAMILRGLGIKFDAEEIEKVMARIIAEVPGTIEKLESMKQTFESIDRRLAGIESQQAAMVRFMLNAQGELLKLGDPLTGRQGDFDGRRPTDNCDSPGIRYRDGGD